MKIFFNPFYRLFTSAISYADEPGGGGGAPPMEKTFSQSEVDRIAAERVAVVTSQFSGIDPKEFRRLKDDEAERQRKKAEEEGQYKKIIDEQKTSFDQETAKLRGELNAERIRNAIESEAARQNAINPGQVRELLKNRVRATEAGAIEVLDAEGKPAFKAGKAVCVADLVEGFLKDNAHFVAAGPGGSGAQGPGYGGGGANTMKRAVFDTLAPAQKSDVVKKGTTIID